MEAYSALLLPSLGKFNSQWSHFLENTFTQSIFNKPDILCLFLDLKKMKSPSLNSQCFAIFLRTRKSKKSSLYDSSPCDCSIVYTSFPIQSNKSIDLLTSWQWSSSNSALALNTNKKFSISLPKRRFNQISAFPWAKSAPENLI